ncbi:MAG: 16S rRNA (cytidine(1402)-2'-O)-methyltransferase [Bdellovibrionales bacterium]|nr:16S rRNA (cytidine(1402)-2'-O)-methyltransferase [Bdellovibrionales bacterium]
MTQNTGKLLVVASPIGNLQDLTPRMHQSLQEADIIAAEDTRRTKILCTHLHIEKPHLIRCDEMKEQQVTKGLIDKLQSGQTVALISDAGTPCISDPGWRLVFEARKSDIPVIPIVGPSAITAALSVSGFPATPFTFYGFLDKKKTRSLQTLTEMFASNHTSVFFESPYRIEKTLHQLLEIEPTRLILMIREISKKFEESLFGTVTQVKERISTTKGEWTIVISPNHDRFKG